MICKIPVCGSSVPSTFRTKTKIYSPLEISKLSFYFLSSYIQLGQVEKACTCRLMADLDNLLLGLFVSPKTFYLYKYIDVIKVKKRKHHSYSDHHEKARINIYIL